MNNKVEIKVGEINQMTAVELLEDTRIQDKFVNMYNKIHGTAIGEAMYTKEKFNLLKLIAETPALQNCTKFSLLGCFLDIASNAITLDPTGRPHCYIIPRAAKTGQKNLEGKDIYEQRAYVMITGYGELFIRKRAGHILHADNPVIVYEGDTFKLSNNNGQKRIIHEADLTKQSDKIIGGYIKITRPDGTFDYSYMVLKDIERLMEYSAKQNTYGKGIELKNANPLYTSNGGQIDRGFFENKLIKHAFDAYPKMSTGSFSTTEDIVPEEPILEPERELPIYEPTYEATTPEQVKEQEPEETHF